MVDMEVCKYCKYFLKNLLSGLEKSSWSHIPAPQKNKNKNWYLYFFVLFVLLYFFILFGLSIRTFMQNLDSVAQKMSELCSI